MPRGTTEAVSAHRRPGKNPRLDLVRRRATPHWTQHALVCVKSVDKQIRIAHANCAETRADQSRHGVTREPRVGWGQSPSVARR